MSEPYTVGGRVFTPKRPCLVRPYRIGDDGREDSFVVAEIAEKDADDAGAECFVKVFIPSRCDWWYFWPRDVLLLSDNFTPGA